MSDSDCRGSRPCDRRRRVASHPPAAQPPAPPHRLPPPPHLEHVHRHLLAWPEDADGQGDSQEGDAKGVEQELGQLVIHVPQAELLRRLVEGERQVALGGARVAVAAPVHPPLPVVLGLRPPAEPLLVRLEQLLQHLVVAVLQAVRERQRRYRAARVDGRHGGRWLGAAAVGRCLLHWPECTPPAPPAMHSHAAQRGSRDPPAPSPPPPTCAGCPSSWLSRLAWWMAPLPPPER